VAIRLRKLARQLDRSPEELVALLSSLGFDKYRSADDMIPEPTADAIRDAWRGAVRAAPAPVLPRRPVPAPSNDLMGRLVPGVARIDAPRTASPPAPTSASPPPAASAAAVTGRATSPSPPAAPPPDPDVAALRAALDAERAALVRARATVDAEREAVATVRSELEDERRRLSDERRAVEHERGRLREVELRLAHRSEDDQGAVALPFLLARRGLRGADEFERAIGALAQRGQLRHVLESLRCDQPERLADLLAQRLILVGGEAPDGLPALLAAVAVAPDRADLPGKVHLDRALSRFGEILLLHGLRRVVIVGGRPAWHKVLRDGLDPRVELRFPVPKIRTAQDAAADVDRSDLVVLWDVDVEPDAAPVYAESRGWIVRVNGDHVLTLLTLVEEALRRGAA
jgi:hypothetical protein